MEEMLTIVYIIGVILLSLGYIFSKTERKMYSDDSFIESKQSNED